MKISPITGPGVVQDKSTPEHVRTSKAIDAFNKASAAPAPTQGQQQEHPVQNASQVSVEELGAIRAQTTEIMDNSTKEEAVDSDLPTKLPEELKPKEETKTSREWAALARQERALRAKAQQQEQAFKAREAALAEREAKQASQAPDLTKYVPRDRLKADTLSVLDEEGVSYDELTQQIIQRQPTDPRVMATINSLKQEIQELKSANEDSKKSYRENQQASYQSAIKQITNDAVALVKANPIEYEAISKTGTVKQVVKLIKDTFDKDGVVMSVEEAAQEVENYLVEENINMVNSVSKIKARLAQNVQSATAAQKTQAQTKQTQPQMKTLTNAASSSRQLSTRERSILAFKGELGKG